MRPMNMIGMKPGLRRYYSRSASYITAFTLGFFLVTFVFRRLLTGIEPKNPSIANGSSCVEKVRAALVDTRRANSKYRAFTELISDDIALEQARLLDESTSKHGRLHCRLVAVKDNVETSTVKWSLR